MKIIYITLFPEVYESFLTTSLVHKAQEKGLVAFDRIDPRCFADGPHSQVDDEIYGGGAGLLIKAKPVINAVHMAMQEHVFGGVALDTHPKTELDWRVIMMTPSQTVFNQARAVELSTCDVLIVVSGRYE